MIRNIKELCKKSMMAVLTGAMLVTGLAGIKTQKVQAQDYWPSSIDVSSQAAIVMEEETGAILYAKNVDTPYYPASITKILTALIALENSDLDEVVTFSPEAVGQSADGSSSISRDYDEQMTMEQCLYGMMLESANECAYAIAEHVGDGDISVFIDLMNKKAEELGCKNTHFSNPNGLPDENHYTSPYDTALISRAAYANTKFAEIVGTRSYNIPPTNKHAEETLLNNHHSMLNYYKTNEYLYDYCLGGKTGYTDAANSTLVTYARKDGMTLVCVVLNAVAPAHYVDTRALFDYCFDNFSVYSVDDTAALFENDSVKDIGMLGDNIDLVKVSDNGVVILPKTANFADASAKVVPSDSSDKSVVGRIEYTYADRYVGGADLIYSSDQAGSYPFHNLDEEEGGSTLSYFRIDFKMTLLIILLLIGSAGIVYLVHLKSGSIILYKKRHFDSKKKPRPKYKQIRRSKRRKRR